MLPPNESGEPWSCRQIRELETEAIERLGIPSLLLMESAARGVSAFIRSILVNPRREPVCVLCGPGNNGGDGLAVARHLRCAGVAVDVVLAQAGDRLRGDAAKNLAIFERIGGRPLYASNESDGSSIRESIARASIIIDGLLGTGSSGPPRGAMADLIRSANSRDGARRVAIDLPSGLDGDSGAVHDPCFRADATVTFVAMKTGFARPEAHEVLGRVMVADIGVPLDIAILTTR